MAKLTRTTRRFITGLILDVVCLFSLYKWLGLYPCLAICSVLILVTYNVRRSIERCFNPIVSTFPSMLIVLVPETDTTPTKEETVEATKVEGENV